MALSPSLAASIENERLARELRSRRERAGAVLDDCESYLSPGVLIVFADEAEPSEQVLADDRRHDVAANLIRCRSWVVFGWRRAKDALLALTTVDEIAQWTPSEAFSAELLPIFVDFLRSDSSDDAVERTAIAVARLRTELADHRVKIGRLFGALRQRYVVEGYPRLVIPTAAIESAPSPLSVPTAGQQSAATACRGDANCEKAVFRKSGSVWVVTWVDRTHHLPDMNGMRYLHALLAAQGQNISVDVLCGTDGVPADGEAQPNADLGGEAVADKMAVKAMKNRLNELADNRRDAERAGDQREIDAIDSERASIGNELRTVHGLGGRRRRMGSESTRRRVRVANALRRALDRIELACPDLGSHLREALHQPASWSPKYAPGQWVEWRLC